MAKVINVFHFFVNLSLRALGTDDVNLLFVLKLNWIQFSLYFSTRQIRLCFVTRGHGICQMLSWQPSSDEISCCSLSLSRQVLLFLPHLLSWGYSTAPCTLHLACSLAGGGGNVGSTVAMPAALVVFNPGVGGVARAPLVPPTRPAEGWPGFHLHSAPVPPCR